MPTFNCSICYYKDTTYKDLFKHYVRCHRNDPHFKVKCAVNQICSSTFTNWKSFLIHLSRSHKNDGEFIHNEVGLVQEDFQQNVLLNEENLQINNVQIDENLNENDFDMQQNDLDEQDLNENEANENEPAYERLIGSCAEFLINIREGCKVSQKAMESIIKGTINLMDTYLSVTLAEINKRKNPDTSTVSFKEINEIFTSIYPPSQVFFTVGTKNRLDNILKEKFNMVNSVPVVLGNKYKWVKKKIQGKVITKYCKIEQEAHIVPFYENLKNLIQNNDVLNNIDNPLPYEHGVYRTVFDGSYCREDAFFSSNKNALGIILYMDDISLTNQQGSSSKKHKMSMIYWTLANIHPQYRSSLNCIQLYGIVKTEYLKTPGALKKVLAPLKTDLELLKKDGINIIKNNVIKNYKGAVIFASADTPAAAVLGGFKESVSAYRLCRSCRTTKDQWQQYFHDSDFTKRNAIDHEKELKIVTDPTITKGAAEYWKTFYGINERSPLMEIIDTTDCLPQDGMHVVVLGPLSIYCKLLLHYCIIEKELFTVEDFNFKMDHFDYAHYHRDKPGNIQRDHLFNDLRQSAAQLISLAHVLPFLIFEWTHDCEDEGLRVRLECFRMLLHIVNISMCYEIHEETIDIFGRIIQIFFIQFKSIYPEEIVPKFHFLTHLPRYVRRFGPTRQQACFRFEGAHAYFKGLTSVVKNFKNISKTLCYRHQANSCIKLKLYSGISKRFLNLEDFIAPGTVLPIINLPQAQLLREFDSCNDQAWMECQIMRTGAVTVNRTEYKPNGIILLKIENDSLPEFGEIQDIFVLHNKVLLVYIKLVTNGYEKKLNAYEVQLANGPKKLHVIDIKSIIFQHPLSTFVALRRKFIPLINHEFVEF